MFQHAVASPMHSPRDENCSVTIADTNASAIVTSATARRVTFSHISHVRTGIMPHKRHLGPERFLGFDTRQEGLDHFQGLL